MISFVADSIRSPSQGSGACGAGTYGIGLFAPQQIAVSPLRHGVLNLIQPQTRSPNIGGFINTFTILGGSLL